MDENEKLTIEVEKFSHLYDLKHPDYKNISKKSNSWNRIAERIGCRDGRTQAYILYKTGITCIHPGLNCGDTLRCLSQS